MFSKSLTLALALASVNFVAAAPAPQVTTEVSYECAPGSASNCSKVVKTVTASATPTVTTEVSYECAPGSASNCSKVVKTVTASATPTATSEVTYVCEEGSASNCKPVTQSAGAAASTSTALAASAASSAASASTSTSSSIPAVSNSDSQWIVRNLSRYCAEDGSSCDYNFDIEGNGRTEHCTLVNNAGVYADFYAQSCGADSAWEANWGLSRDADPQFAVLTIDNVQSKTRAFFGVPDVNGQDDTTFGSGSYGDVGPSPVETY